MPLSTTQYGFIIDPLVPLTDDTGRTISNGYVRVFMAGTSTPVITYKNFDGATNEETIQLDNSGRTAYPVIGSKGSTYKVCVYDAEHSQESPILTIDKVVPAGANVEATTIVTGLDNVESPEAGWVKSSVSGTDAEVSLDATNVTSEVDTMVKATAASADYMMPLVHKTGSDPDKKITLGNIFKFVLNFIHSLTDTATEADLVSGNYFALDGSAGTKKLNSTTLLTKTAQNALAGNVAPAFVPNSTNAVANMLYVYGGMLYVAKEAYQGPWDASKFELIDINSKFNALLRPELQAGYYITAGNTLPSFVESSSYKSCLIDVVAGQTLLVVGAGSTGARLWATYDIAGNCVRRSDASVTYTEANPLELQIQTGEVKFIFNTSLGANLDRYVAFKSIENVVNAVSSNIATNKKSADDEFLRIEKSASTIIYSGVLQSGSSRLTIKERINKKFNMRFRIKFDAYSNAGSAASKIYGSFFGTDAFIRVGSPVGQSNQSYSGGGESGTEYFPFVSFGNLNANSGSSGRKYYNAFLGDIAFSVQYTGEETTASFENNGTSIVLKDGATTTTLTLGDYSTMADLYAALNEVSNFTFQFSSLEGHTPSELTCYSEIKLKSKFYRNVDGSYSGTPVLYEEAAPFFVRYVNDRKWHDVEVFSNGDDYLNICFDGTLYRSSKVIDESEDSTIILLPERGFSYKDIQLCKNSDLDAEVVSVLDNGASRNIVISDFSPMCVIFEGHGLEDVIGTDTTDNLSTSTDRLCFLHKSLKEKGYIAISIDDVIAWMTGNKQIPKRSYTFMHDDYRFNDFLTQRCRAPFIDNGSKPSLAVITGLSSSETILVGDNEVTIDKASRILEGIGISCYSHTKNHTNVNNIKYSDTQSVISESITDADYKEIKSTAMVFPNGESSPYVSDVLEFLGVAIGISTTAGVNTKNVSPYMLRRVDIGSRTTDETILSYIV